MNVWHPLCLDLEKRITEGQIAMFEGTTRKDKFKEGFLSLSINNSHMLTNGMPIQGIFVNNTNNPTTIVNNIGGVVENVTIVGDRSYASIRGGRITVLPEIMEQAITEYPDTKFLLSMHTHDS